MAEGTIRVRGLKETQRALGKCEGGLRKEMLLAGKAAAEPVAAAARGKISRYQGASLSTIRPRAGARGAFVTQGARTVDGRHGYYGALNMYGLLHALDENKEQVVRIYEVGLLRLTKSAGF